MKNENSRLTPFIGNEPLCESEHGGEPIHKESFSGTDYLEPVSEHQKCLHDYAIQVQRALNPMPKSDETENKGSLPIKGVNLEFSFFIFFTDFCSQPKSWLG